MAILKSLVIGVPIRQAVNTFNITANSAILSCPNYMELIQIQATCGRNVIKKLPMAVK